MQTKLRKKKMLLVLPILVIPFITLAFYALGGGKGKVKDAVAESGLNLKVPDAKLREEKLLDKLGFYEKAAKDSAKMEEWMRSDPYYKEREEMEANTGELEEMTAGTASKYNQRLKPSPYEVNNKPEEQVMQRLSMLQKELNKSTTVPVQMNDEGYERARPELSGDVERLEAMMKGMTGSQGEDPEIKQLSTVMDKILDAQHPERVKERLVEKSVSTTMTVLTVSATAPGDTTTTGFFGLENDLLTQQSNAIQAVVHENQLLVNGAVIKLRLLQDVFVGGEKIPSGNFVFGIVNLQAERLVIEIHSIRHGSSLYTVKMEVHDMDGLPGIHIPGAITRDVAKQSADNSLQMMELTTLDPSLKAQAAAAGIQTAKSLLSRKVKLIKVMVKAGYRVLLKAQ
jgi:conjugative transposon TraM protein